MFTKWVKKVVLVCAVSLLGTLAIGCGGSGTPASTSGGSAATPSTATSASSDMLKTIQDRGYLIAGVKHDVPAMGQLRPGGLEPEGFEIDLMKALAKKIFGDENKIKLEKVESKTRISMLQNGQVDIVAGTTTITEERKQQVDFSDVYFLAGQSLLAQKGGSVQSVNDLKGKVVATVQGSTSAMNIRQMAPDAQVLEFPTYTEAFLALKQGRTDAMTTDNSILMGFAANEPDYELMGGPFSQEPYGLAFQKGHPEWVKYCNDFLKEMKDSGKYAELYKKWFKAEPPK
ncbi:ABC transporter substrate-binding protein [Heliophilum fasciatum]|uniref:Amino acid ABC transporter substrate-binding protein (PAAT family) n=1 Tax=Heliophilum fasciatum TaxID=35700 RepID=A0A4R2RI26_9FIRM|nr:ABC transporter substrate-binding protein [Heliophilum fasciatum]MCW2278793.1 putative glutamine transport system substrate-binding protein [Heliophilum fasciatum]TCP62464.1 amino acid ABC transporter substrate-binding protein (PAAT family) [Heliophilum fasciatum]